MLLKIQRFLTNPRPGTAITWASLLHTGLIAASVVCLATARDANLPGDNRLIYLTLSERQHEPDFSVNVQREVVELSGDVRPAMFAALSNHANAPIADMQPDSPKDIDALEQSMLAAIDRQELHPSFANQNMTTEEPTVIQRQTVPLVSPRIASRIPEVSGSNNKTPPDFSGNRQPAYPSAAIRRGYEGQLLLRLYVAESGRVERVVVVRSTGHEILDRSAVATVSRWTGKPAQFNGRPIATIELLPVIFRLPRR